jgi:uncharacterized protein Yka (UPF0111/DUF47 family)
MGDGIRERLFPNEETFFAAFVEVTKRLTQAADLLIQGLEDPTRLSTLVATIQAVGREADEAAHAVELRVERLFIPPMDPEDIHMLSTRLRRVVDGIAGAARRAVSLHVTERREPAVRFAGLLVNAAQEIQAAVANLRDGRQVLERCQVIKQIEEDGDGIWETAISELFAGTPDPLQVLCWKALYDQLEDTLDACDDVGNELETIAVKHA